MLEMLGRERKLKRLVLLLGVLVVLVLLPSLATAAENYHFIFIPKLVHPWYEAVKQGADAAVSELKKKGINVTYEWDAPPVADILVHTQKIEAAIAKRPDALAVSVLDPASDTPVIKEAIKAGLKVITFDCDAPESGRAIFVGHDKNEQDGRDLAEYLAQKMNYQGEVAILIGSLGAPNHVQRVKGFKEVIAKYPKMKIVAEAADNDDLQKAVALAENILQAHPNVKGFFGCNASNPIGIAQAVKDAGKAGKVFIVGMDDMPETINFIKEGVISATKVQNVFDIGYWSIMYMVQLAQGKSVPKEHPTGSYIVTKDNLAEYLKKTGK